MIRNFFLSLLFLAGTAGLMAQNLVEGTVLDSQGEPLPGVRVEVIGTTEVVSTDLDGRFRFNLPQKPKRVKVTYAGYKPLVVNVRPDLVIKLGDGWEGQSSGYRGFIDINGGVAIGGKLNVYAGDYSITNLKQSFVYGFTMTHGYQINHNLFVGLGFGAYAEMLQANVIDSEYLYGDDYEAEFYCINIPIFADVRWDFGLASKAAPFIDLKIGYQFNQRVGGDAYVSYYRWNSNVYINKYDAAGFYLQPSIGIRTRLKGKAGINIGLSYNVSLPKKLGFTYVYQEGYYSSSYGESSRYRLVSEREPKTSYAGVLMMNVGFDF